MPRLVKEQDKEIKQFLDIKGSVYQDERCVISRSEGGLVCAFKEDHTPSKRQREWMVRILSKTAEREYGKDKFKIEQGENKHFYLIANEKDTAQSSRKDRKAKQEG
jgi:hypothetical protein